jgi:hypothetical protein
MGRWQRLVLQDVRLLWLKQPVGFLLSELTGEESRKIRFGIDVVRGAACILSRT